MKYESKISILKISAIADFICVIGLVIALISVCGANKDLRNDKRDLETANQILIDEIVNQQNDIIEKDNYINYLENIAVEADLFEYNK